MVFLSLSVVLCRSRVRARLWRFVDNCRIVSVEVESAALECLSISVVLCRSRVRARQWRFCRYLSHCVGRGGECGFGVFVVICRIMSVEGKSTAFAFLSITVAFCRMREERGFSVLSVFVALFRSRWSEWLRMFCRYLSHCVGQGGVSGFGCFVDNCRIVSVEGEGEAFAFLSISVAFCRQWRERGSGAAVERGKGAVRGTNIVFNLLKKR